MTAFMFFMGAVLGLAIGMNLGAQYFREQTVKAIKRLDEEYRSRRDAERKAAEQFWLDAAKTQTQPGERC